MRSAVLVVTFAAACLLVGCEEKSTPAPPPTPAPPTEDIEDTTDTSGAADASTYNPSTRLAEASTYNPDTRLADASTGGADEPWEVTDRSLAQPLPAQPRLAPEGVAGNAALASFEYPGSTFERSNNLNGAEVYHYRTSDPFTSVAAHYDARNDLRSETPDLDKAHYTRTLPTGGTLTIAVTGQQTGGTKITLSVAP